MPTFEVLVRDNFSALTTDGTLTPIGNKSVLSLLNDFEDEKWMHEKFQNFIWDNIAETALTVRERSSLSAAARPHSTLVKAAKNLRLLDSAKKDTGAGSEIAEIALYGIMKEYYQALSVVPKIFYKQNANDYAKGADSVHIVLEGDDDFSLWFGESKFYDDIKDARLDKIVASVEESLKSDKLKKENSIITNVSDLDEIEIDDERKQQIKALLDTDISIDQLKPKLNIPILLLHECEITKECKALDDGYRKSVRDFHAQRATAYFRKQIKKFSASVSKYSEIRFHILLLPVPEKKGVVDAFISLATGYRGI